MSIRNLFFICILAFLGACSSDIFLDRNGNMPDQEKVNAVSIGQTKAEVRAILGAPSAVAALSDDHWIYMSSTIKRVAFLRPDEIDRNVLALTFQNDRVSKIEKRTLDDANDITINKDETKSADHEIGFFRKYFGGVGNYMPFGNPSKREGL